MRNTSAFEITSIEVEPTEHVSAESVQSLAQVPAGSTLLNVDTNAIEEALRKNPWVASVDFDRRFPSTLGIRIQEQRVDALVLMSSGAVAWYLSDQGTWIEPVMVEPAEGQSTNDAALAIARDNGCLLVTDVPATVEPSAGAEATDATLDAVAQFREGFSSDFNAQIVCFRAPSAEGISCVLENGVEVSLGAPTDIAEKERIVEGYLAEHEGGLLLINVRVVSSPAYRELSSDNLTFGSGVNPEEEPEEPAETDE
nr:FtsQ-type POTRA domain-containing protein [Thermophilibacter gallinarum]